MKTHTENHPLTKFGKIHNELILFKWMLGVLVVIAIANFAKQFM